MGSAVPRGPAAAGGTGATVEANTDTSGRIRIAALTVLNLRQAAVYPEHHRVLHPCRHTQTRPEYRTGILVAIVATASLLEDILQFVIQCIAIGKARGQNGTRRKVSFAVSFMSLICGGSSPLTGWCAMAREPGASPGDARLSTAYAAVKFADTPHTTAVASFLVAPFLERSKAAR